MKKLVIVLISGILVFAMGSVQARPEAAQAKAMVKISGRVTDFEGRPVQGAAVELKNSRFENAAEGVSDKVGRYALTFPRGTYMALAAVKDYQVNSLEYWAWNVPAGAFTLTLLNLSRSISPA